MALTRPSGYPIVSDSSAIVDEEVAQIDGRGRLYLAPGWTQRIPWWVNSSAGDFSVLMVFVEPGLVSMRDLTTDGPRIAARYSELVDLSNEDAMEALRLIQDRYRRLPIDKERRAHIGDAGLAHLGLSIERGEKSTVYVAIFPSRLDILSPTYRNMKMASGSPWLDDLP
jgi:hypothetical protein